MIAEFLRWKTSQRLIVVEAYEIEFKRYRKRNVDGVVFLNGNLHIIVVVVRTEKRASWK